MIFPSKELHENARSKSGDKNRGKHRRPVDKARRKANELGQSDDQYTLRIRHGSPSQIHRF